MKLQFARLYYGSTGYLVIPNETLPLPVEFDFDHPEDCAKLIFAIMSNASGGHVLTDCKLKIHRGRKSANLTCNGAHVYYKDESLPLLTLEEVLKMETEFETFELGRVVTDQYGDGWKRARWDVARCA